MTMMTTPRDEHADELQRFYTKATRLELDGRTVTSRRSHYVVAGTTTAGRPYSVRLDRQTHACSCRWFAQDGHCGHQLTLAAAISKATRGRAGMSMWAM